MPDNDTPPNGHVKKNTKFPDPIKVRLNSFYPEYDTYIKKENPTHQPRHAGVSDWHKGKATTLMKEQAFKSLVTQKAHLGLEATHWEKVNVLLNLDGFSLR